MADSKRADQHAGPGLEAPRRRTHAIPVRRRALIDALASEATPTTTAVAQQRWRDESPTWIKRTESTGIKLD